MLNESFWICYMYTWTTDGSKICITNLLYVLFARVRKTYMFHRFASGTGTCVTAKGRSLQRHRATARPVGRTTSSRRTPRALAFWGKARLRSILQPHLAVRTPIPALMLPLVSNQIDAYWARILQVQRPVTHK